MRQAERDLGAARNSLESGDYEWACFQAQQGAEKAAKAALQSMGEDVRGHSVTMLLKSLEKFEPISSRLFTEARKLDRHYISSRYPDSYDTGTPSDYYDGNLASSAIKSAEDVLKKAKKILG